MTYIIPLAIIAMAVALYLLSKSSKQSGVHRNFGLDQVRYKLVATDLGGSTNKIRLTYSGVSGDPDAVFEDRKKPRIIIGEHKARKLRRGLRAREYYQLILYIGLGRMRWPSHEVVGLLSYTDKTVWVEHDQKVFDALMALKPEAVASIRARKARNSTPLHKRISIRLPRI